MQHSNASQSFSRTPLLALVAVTAIVLSSCKIMYVPNNQNVPLFKEKGEVRATVGTRNFQAAYAATDNIGVMANAQIGSSDWTIPGDSSTTTATTNRNMFELGAGYFKAINDKSTFEAYGGFGYGTVNFNQSNDVSLLDNRYKAGVAKFFFQPSIGTSDEYFDIALSTRFVGLKFNNIDTVGYTYEDLVFDNINDLNRGMFFFLEPALTVRFGYRWVKLHTQLGYSIKMSSADLNYNPLIVTTGVHINLAKRHNE